MVGSIRTMLTQVTESRYKSTVKTKACKTNNQASFCGSLLQKNMEVDIGGQKRVNFAICLHRFTQFAHGKLCVNFFCCFSNLV